MRGQRLFRPIRGTLWGAVVLALLCFASLDTARAQVLYGSVSGNVRDTTGGAIPGVEVTITNPATNFSQTAVTNEAGAYLITNVPRGTYTLRATMSGFREFVNENVVVTVGNVTRQDVTLQVGGVAETITVSGASTLLQTDTSEVKVQVESKEITDLPLNQYRNYQSLLNLVPGATPGEFQNAVTDTPGRALTTNVNGTARNNNNTRIDGAQSVNIWLPHHTAYVPPSETIEVVNVSTNNFDAEQGFAGGAALTVVTKSGTNELSGSVFGYHENSALNARDFFNYLDDDGDGEADNPAGRRSITGFTLGGPIMKDKFFFFGGWEGTFQGLARTQTVTVATAAQRAGDFSAFLPGADPNVPDAIIFDPLSGNPDGTGRTPFPNNIIPQDRMSPAARTLQDLVPLPNLPGVTDNFERSGTEALDRHNIDAKVDYYFSENYRTWGKFSFMDAEVTKDAIFGPAGGGAIGGGGDGRGLTDVKVYGIGHTWTITPTFLMDGNFGVNDMDQEVLTADIDTGNFGQEVLGIPGTNSTEPQSRACMVGGINRCGGVPRFGIGGYAALGQVDGWSPLFRDEDSYTFTNNFSWTKGNHETRFGYDMVRHDLIHWQPEIGPGPRGNFEFPIEVTGSKGAEITPSNANGYAAFLLGQTTELGKSLQWELMTANEWQHAVYFRDRWQLTPNLTLNVGLRYEYYPLVTRDDREMEFLDFETFNVILENNIKVSRNNFAPRIGFAYRISDNDVIRSGYGITYDPLPFARPLRGFFPLTIAGTFRSNDPFVPQQTLDEGIPIFTGPETSPGAVIPLPSFVEMRTMPEDEVHRGYIQSWNLVYERKLPGDVVTSIGYVGTQTTNQLADHLVNWSPPGGGTEGRQLFPRSDATIRFWDGWLSANYHSLQVAINRRFTGGFFLKGAYTYSRAINMTDDDGWAELMWNDPSILFRNRAQAGFNRPHVLQLAAIYDLPFGRTGDGALSKIIRGWQVNGIFSVSENEPFTVTSANTIETVHNSQTADQIAPNVETLGGIRDTPYYDTSAFAPVNRIPGQTCTGNDCYGTAGRNILRGPTWVNMDFSLFRRFALAEDVGLEFRSEFFNITNTPHFNNPEPSANSSNFMRILSTSDNAPERIVRFGLRLSF
ncbi:MAG TPA: TonB-dependent receptor [Acidobacteriota bacterium]|nr:TonB-dependent receptor [Acidobacteriota bacterium]